MTINEFDTWETEVQSIPLVYGNDVGIVESYHALLWVATTFGDRVHEELKAAIFDNFPSIREIEENQDSEEFMRVQIAKSEDPVFYGKVMDTLAEAVVYAHRWVWAYMQAHRHDELTLLVPCVTRPTVQMWHVDRSLSVCGADGTPVALAATLPGWDRETAL